MGHPSLFAYGTSMTRASDRVAIRVRKTSEHLDISREVRARYPELPVVHEIGVYFGLLLDFCRDIVGECIGDGPVSKLPSVLSLRLDVTAAATSVAPFIIPLGVPHCNNILEDNVFVSHNPQQIHLSNCSYTEIKGVESVQQTTTHLGSRPYG